MLPPSGFGVAYLFEKAMRMKVGIIQSCYLPWRGYFDFIRDVDLFVFFDDTQFTRRDWRNRNKIKTAQGPVWITVSVNDVYASQSIFDTGIDYAHDWPQRHINLFRQWYSKAPFYSDYAEELFALIRTPRRTISDLNVVLTQWIVAKLGIKTELHLSSEYHPQGLKTERLIDILKKVKATAYVSGPSARDYMQEDRFREEKIRLEYKNYDYAPYPQLWGDFNGAVTVMDLLFNTGPEAVTYLKSRGPNEVAVDI